jgi:hypothetical protein
MSVERPAIVTERHLKFLDNLRDSGATNMYAASAYLERKFKQLTEEEAGVILVYWMKSFTERHPEVMQEQKRADERIAKAIGESKMRGRGEQPREGG